VHYRLGRLYQAMGDRNPAQKRVCKGATACIKKQTKMSSDKMSGRKTQGEP